MSYPELENIFFTSLNILSLILSNTIKLSSLNIVSSDIADTMIPLGTSFHKDGSIIGSVFKIMFLVCLFNTDISSINSILKIFGVSALANLLVMAVPVGGGTISEMMIITLIKLS